MIAPDGSVVAAAGDQRDQIVTTDLDLAKATGQNALRRSQHPLFKPWWEMGKAIHAGKEFPQVDSPPLVSSTNSVKCGFARLRGTATCSVSIGFELGGSNYKFRDLESASERRVPKSCSMIALMRNTRWLNSSTCCNNLGIHLFPT